MNPKLPITIITMVLLLAASGSVQAQYEMLVPLGRQPKAKAALNPKPGIHPGSELEMTDPVSLPFYDDFSNYTGAPSPICWEPGGGATVGTGATDYPPTVGVVTLDAINGVGGFVSDATPLGGFVSDTLLSVPIRLDSVTLPRPRPLTLADSIGLSFYYLPGGGKGDQWERSGHTPGPGDSLVLDFWDATNGRWVRVWGCGGVSEDTLLARTGHSWQYACVMVRKEEYLRRSFRFRFHNICSLDNVTEAGMVGNTDEWHLDCISMAPGNNAYEQSERDVAFVQPAPSMLRHYTAMPARQFGGQSDMKTDLSIVITNRYEQTLSSHYSYEVRSDNGALIYNYEGGIENIPSYLTTGEYQTTERHAHPVVPFVFPSTGEQRTYHITHIVHEGVGGDDHQENDTITFHQVFADYYAFDDGTAENGYGISGSSKNKLAMQFAMRQADTLTAVDIFFNQVYGHANEKMYFRIVVWNDKNGVPGDIIYKDQNVRKPQFTDLEHFFRYRLEEPLVVTGTVYVGIEQTTSGFINIGYDRSNDAREFFFYNAGSGWMHSLLKGTPMMRPYFGVAATVGVRAVEAPVFSFYPNPAAHTLYLQGVQPQWQIAVSDVQGRQWISGTGGTLGESLSVAELPVGAYLLRVTDPAAQTASTKVFVINR